MQVGLKLNVKELTKQAGMYVNILTYVHFYVIIMQFSKTMNEKSFETFYSQNCYSGENLQFSKFFKKFTILATKNIDFRKQR